MEAVQDFAETLDENGLPRYDIEFIEPTEDSIRFRIRDGNVISTLPAVYEKFFDLFQIHGEYATQSNCRVAYAEEGPYIEFRYTDIVA